MNIDRELLRGSTNLLVLSVLEKENLYGYQMIKKLKMKSENVFHHIGMKVQVKKESITQLQKMAENN